MKKDIVNETLRMAWPAILESFFVALAGLVDSYMVSSLGKEAVASVGLTTQPKFLGLAVFIAINVSVSALVARRKANSAGKPPIISPSPPMHWPSSWQRS